MSSGWSVSPRFLFSLFAFTTAAATERHATSYRAQMSAMFRLGRRESPAHVAGPRPEYPIPYITPGPPDDIVAPKSPVVAACAGGEER
ncbi:hypothetical protein DBV15_10004 [Temnothorax longispinosus]|uniref:Secreted protein n=1 Tax=Temnothorax longispinosus TaxID=300112 RepID=A0A4S2KUW7_9HYME|nr:hypothetical protein DBV15_10004 [Temnothorax longispinosus]